jgi:hypothetical protein
LREDILFANLFAKSLFIKRPELLNLFVGEHDFIGRRSGF